jgi:hypothetical protein
LSVLLAVACARQSPISASAVAPDGAANAPPADAAAALDADELRRDLPPFVFSDSGPEAAPDLAPPDATPMPDAAAPPRDTASPPDQAPPPRDTGVDLARGTREAGPGATIESFEMSNSSGAYLPSLGMFALSGHGTYRLSDGRSWESGAGSARSGTMRLVSVERDGTMLVYRMTPEQLLLERTDYDSGNHSANFRLEGEGEIVIRAAVGSRVGMASGQVRVAVDEPANYTDNRFNYLSAPVGTVVRFTATYTLRTAVFYENLFETGFDYGLEGRVDFTSRI